MEINRKLINPLSFITTNGVCTLFQLVVLFILVVVQFFLWIVSGSLISIFLGNSPYVMDVAAITSWATVFVLYALVWYFYWRGFYNWFKEEFKWFYWNITFATTPLVFALIMFSPHPDPMAMIPLSSTEIKFQFSTIVTGIVLFPLYSISLHKFVFMKPSSYIRTRNTVYVCLSIVGIGWVLFLIGWNLMQPMYH